MAELILRAEAIAEIEEYIEEYSDLDENGYHNLKWCAMEEARDVLSMLPVVEPFRWLDAGIASIGRSNPATRNSVALAYVTISAAAGTGMNIAATANGRRTHEY